MRIISTPGGSSSKNPFLLSEEEQEEVRRRQLDLQHGLTIPRRLALLSSMIV